MKVDRKMGSKREHGQDGFPVLVLSGVLAFAAVLTLPQILNLHGNTLAVGKSWFGVPVYGMVWFLCCRAMTGIRQECGKDGGHGMTVAGIMACLFSVCLAFGVQLECRESVDFLSGALWFTVLVWTLVFMLWIYYGWIFLGRRGEADSGRTGRKAEIRKREKAEEAKAGAGRMVCLRMLEGKWDGLSGK